MRIALLFGGTSAERDVSVASAAQVFRALRDLGHEVSAFDTATGRLTREGETALLDAAVAPTPPNQQDIPAKEITAQLISELDELRAADVIFLALHGGTGEDGTLQALLDTANLCYTGSGQLPSAVSMDKDLSKRLFRFAGVPTPNWLMAPATADVVTSELGFPVVVKPNKQGSTIGLTVVKSPDQLGEAIEIAKTYDKEVMIEEFIAGREFVVGVLDGQPLAVGEIEPQCSEIFDYQSKYQPGGAIETFPAEIPKSDTTKMQRLAVAAHQALKLGGYSRVDFRMDHNGDFWCLEANTLPGMTATSLLPQSANAAGIPFPKLCEQLCLLALRDREDSD